jgi:hypothetical protein
MLPDEPCHAPRSPGVIPFPGPSCAASPACDRGPSSDQSSVIQCFQNSNPMRCRELGALPPPEPELARVRHQSAQVGQDRAIAYDRELCAVQYCASRFLRWVHRKSSLPDLRAFRCRSRASPRSGLVPLGRRRPRYTRPGHKRFRVPDEREQTSEDPGPRGHTRRLESKAPARFDPFQRIDGVVSAGRSRSAMMDAQQARISTATRIVRHPPRVQTTDIGARSRNCAPLSILHRVSDRKML